jgi:DNA-directed RNA polymerase specialized sigma24 family protein
MSNSISRAGPPRASVPEGRGSALDDFCANSWLPVYAFVRTKVCDPERAKDLTQAFFTGLLERGEGLPVRLEYSSLRHYLLGSVRHFLSNEWDRQRAQKRGGGIPSVVLDFECPCAYLMRQMVQTLTPEKIFEKHCATVLLGRARHALRQEFEARGKGPQFDRLESCLTREGAAGHYRDIGAGLGMSAGAVKTAVHRMRRRFGEKLREEIAQTVDNPAAVEDELRHLFVVVGS